MGLPSSAMKFTERPPKDTFRVGSFISKLPHDIVSVVEFKKGKNGARGGVHPQQPVTAPLHCGPGKTTMYTSPFAEVVRVRIM